MAKLNQKQVQAEARTLLAAAPSGLRWAELLNAIALLHPETPPGTIRGSVRLLMLGSPDIVKVARGAYQLAAYQ